jgi:hypothetical protein
VILKICPGFSGSVSHRVHSYLRNFKRFMEHPSNRASENPSPAQSRLFDRRAQIESMKTNRFFMEFAPLWFALLIPLIAFAVALILGLLFS